MVFVVSACSVFEASVRTAIDEAVSAAVEREMSAMLAGYTDVMMFQLAYTQAFFLGGFGIMPEDFEEGYGATWRVSSHDREEEASYTAERALLRRLDDGSTWWYLTFDSDDAEKIEFEIRLGPDLQAMEMYLRDPETGDIRYHEFAYDETEAGEMEESEESLEAYGYQTGYYYAETWSDYREESVELTIGAGTFNTDVLLFSPRDMDPDADYRFEYRWWVTDQVPGFLVKFEYKDLESEDAFQGELIEMRDDYRPRFAGPAM